MAIKELILTSNLQVFVLLFVIQENLLLDEDQVIHRSSMK